MFGNKMEQVSKAIEKKSASKLIKLCEDTDQEVRMAAIAGLGVVGGDDASNYLVFHLKNPNPEVRVAIAKALGILGDMHTKAFVLAQMNKEKDPDVLEALRKALGTIKDY